MATILVIDDDDSVRGLLVYWLRQAGHCVFDASDGSAGMNMLEAQAADVVVCDLFMPKKEGLETIPELRRRFPTMKVVAISGGSFEFDFLPAAKLLGADKTIKKPFNGDLFVKLIASVLPERK
jgi:two-component system response regulator (stage 0 sporulation protein F)